MVNVLFQCPEAVRVLTGQSRVKLNPSETELFFFIDSLLYSMSFDAVTFPLKDQVYVLWVLLEI